LHVQFENVISDPVSLKITDVNGRVLYTAETSEQTFMLDMKDFVSGVYFVSVTNEDYAVVRKVVKG